MSDRAYNNGVVVGAAIAHAGTTVKRSAVATGKAVKVGARSTKDVTTSFWAGLKSGIKAPNAQLGTSTPQNAKPVAATHSVIIRL